MWSRRAGIGFRISRSHALRGNGPGDALRRFLHASARSLAHRSPPADASHPPAAHGLAGIHGPGPELLLRIRPVLRFLLMETCRGRTTPELRAWCGNIPAGAVHPQGSPATRETGSPRLSSLSLNTFARQKSEIRNPKSQIGFASSFPARVCHNGGA